MMHKSYKNSMHDTSPLKSEKGQRDQFLFTEETITSLAELGSVLREIRQRLISEGYEIKDGKITKHENDQQTGDATHR